MGNLFGKGKANENTQKAEVKPSLSPKDKAIWDLKVARDNLQKFRKRLESDSATLYERSRILVQQKHNDRALLLLKLRKYKQNEVGKVDAQLFTVLQMIDNVEWEAINEEVVNALKTGNAALKKMQQEITLEYVEDLMEQTNEAIAKEREISDMLAGHISSDENEELERELELIMGGLDQSKQKQPTVAAAISLPVASNKTILPKAPETSILIVQKESQPLPS